MLRRSLHYHEPQSAPLRPHQRQYLFAVCNQQLQPAAQAEEVYEEDWSQAPTRQNQRLLFASAVSQRIWLRLSFYHQACAAQVPGTSESQSKSHHRRRRHPSELGEVSHVPDRTPAISGLIPVSANFTGTAGLSTSQERKTISSTPQST